MKKFVIMNLTNAKNIHICEVLFLNEHFSQRSKNLLFFAILLRSRMIRITYTVLLQWICKKQVLDGQKNLFCDPSTTQKLYV